MSVIKLTKNNFHDEVKESPKAVLIDFFANWCGPCRMVSPIVDEIAEQNPNYKICKVNVDEEPELAQAFEVSSIPTLAVVKDGVLRARSVGVKSKEAILAMLEG